MEQAANQLWDDSSTPWAAHETWQVLALRFEHLYSWIVSLRFEHVEDYCIPCFVLATSILRKLYKHYKQEMSNWEALKVESGPSWSIEKEIEKINSMRLWLVAVISFILLCFYLQWLVLDVSKRFSRFVWKHLRRDEAKHQGPWKWMSWWWGGTRWHQDWDNELTWATLQKGSGIECTSMGLKRARSLALSSSIWLMLL